MKNDGINCMNAAEKKRAETPCAERVNLCCNAIIRLVSKFKLCFDLHCYPYVMTARGKCIATQNVQWDFR